MKSYKAAVIGATGMVGRTMLKVLEERKFPVKSIRLFASERSKGTKIKFNNENISVEKLEAKLLKGLEIVLLSAGGAVSREYCPIIAKYGGIAIDNSSAWRMDKNVPLVVPGVNSHAIKKHKGIIANPNCSTIQLVVVLKPIHDAVRIKRIVVSTYQAVSGKGWRAMEELKNQVESFSRGGEFPPRVFTQQIAFNVIPHIDEFSDGGYTKEELKMVNETKKIMGDNTIRVSATTVRVPVMNCHSESVNIETDKKITVKAVKELLKKAKGVKLLDDPANNIYPTPITADGKDECFVGRIREDDTIKNGINLWIVADNLRKGAAFNAVQIAEYLTTN